MFLAIYTQAFVIRVLQIISQSSLYELVPARTMQ